MERARARFNYNDYLLLPEHSRYEILDGELYVAPAPNTKHQRVSRKLETALIEYVESNALGEVFDAPYDVILSDEDIVQPDLIFVRKERDGIIKENNVRGAPDLIVEILSETTRARDLKEKRKIYARFQVAEYWIVDPQAETVQVLLWTHTGYTVAGTYRKSDRLSSPLTPGLDLPLTQVFA
jgi:Uma2 family endonuclease